MTSVVPPTINDAISFFENHLLPWATNQANIGVTIQQMADITTVTTAARTAFNTAEQSRTNSKDDTQTLSAAVVALRTEGAAFMKTIRAFAEASGNPAVLQLASIPPVPAAAPLPPPVTPTNFIGQLNSNGHVELSWTGDISGRMFFTVERQVTAVGAPAGSWELLGSVPKTVLIDTAVPPGASSVAYRIAARRGQDQSIFTDPVSVLLATPGAAVA